LFVVRYAVAAESERTAAVAPLRGGKHRHSRGEIRQLVKENRSERPMTLPEAARFLNVSERWMRRAVAQRSVPFIKLGRQLRFLPEDLRSVLEAGRVESASRPARR
jgi:excisionase family DNA binding protein